jgi:hypothetical protein
MRSEASVMLPVSPAAMKHSSWRKVYRICGKLKGLAKPGKADEVRCRLECIRPAAIAHDVRSAKRQGA